jgi:hypothetical protein
MSIDLEFSQCGFELQAAPADVSGRGIFGPLNPNYGLCEKQIGWFLDALLVYEHNSSHDHCLRFGARIG